MHHDPMHIYAEKWPSFGIYTLNLTSSAAKLS